MFTHLHYVPLSLVLFFPISFGICYSIALELDHINAFFTFISDVGTLPPEQYVFAQFMNMGAALYAYFVYIRYRQVESVLARPYAVSNIIGLAFGLVSSIGMTLVGNFPELHLKEIHYTGAFLTFVGASIYSIFQGYFTYKMLPRFRSKFIAYMRIFLGILGLMIYFGAQASLILAFHRLKNKEKLENTPDSLKWTKKDGGYPFRTASVVMEWLLVIIFDTFIITFIPEFKTFRLEEPQIKFFDDISVLQVPSKNENDDDDEPSETPSDMQMPITIVLEGPTVS